MLPLLAAQLDKPSTFAVALNRRGNHCGVVYQSENEDLRYLHLAWHTDLRDEPASLDALYCVVPSLSVANCEVMALIAEELYAANGPHGIPYSLDSMGIEFDSVTFEFISAGLGSGLTCATFVVTLFRRAGFPLVDVSTWEWDASDEEFREWVIQALQKRLGPDDPHVQAMQSKPAAFRVRPLDVGVAAALPSSTWPVEFSVVRMGVPDLVSRLESA